MKQTGKGWNVATVLVQSSVIFFITFLLCATPHLWDETYAIRFGGAPLPALTQWLRDVLPKDFSGMVCLSLIVTMSHFCIGMMLLSTAKTELSQTQRTVFLSTTTW